MLARVANYLFWLGRYVERTEHTARYLKVQYFSSLDDPLKNNKNKNLQSVLEMVGIPYMKDSLSEDYVLDNVALNMENTNSIISTMYCTMSNANNARDALSLELYEVISKFYYYVENYSADYLKSSGLYDFTQSIIENTAIIRNFIDSTLLHDEAWASIRLGIHLERAVQVGRIVKAIENQILQVNPSDQSYNLYIDYYKDVLLRSLEAEVMYNKFYQGNTTEGSIYEFTILNDLFPRSIYYNIRKSVDICDTLFTSAVKDDPLKFRINKMADEFKYTLYSDFKDNHMNFLKNTIFKLEFITYTLEKDHLSL
ncbi:MAG: alpha-E domain-containing protein [Bacteroidetes bacterium]|nr:alpha-E domain-containing protein [Bacteroidota bacterium]